MDDRRDQRQRTRSRERPTSREPLRSRERSPVRGERSRDRAAHGELPTRDRQHSRERSPVHREHAQASHATSQRDMQHSRGRSPMRLEREQSVALPPHRLRSPGRQLSGAGSGGADAADAGAIVACTRENMELLFTSSDDLKKLVDVERMLLAYIRRNTDVPALTVLRGLLVRVKFGTYVLDIVSRYTVPSDGEHEGEDCLVMQGPLSDMGYIPAVSVSSSDPLAEPGWREHGQSELAELQDFMRTTNRNLPLRQAAQAAMRRRAALRWYRKYRSKPDMNEFLSTLIEELCDKEEEQRMRGRFKLAAQQTTPPGQRRRDYHSPPRQHQQEQRQRDGRSSPSRQQQQRSDTRSSPLRQQQRSNRLSPPHQQRSDWHSSPLQRRRDERSPLRQQQQRTLPQQEQRHKERPVSQQQQQQQPPPQQQQQQRRQQQPPPQQQQQQQRAQDGASCREQVRREVVLVGAAPARQQGQLQRSVSLGTVAGPPAAALREHLQPAAASAGAAAAADVSQMLLPLVGQQQQDQQQQQQQQQQQCVAAPAVPAAALHEDLPLPPHLMQAVQPQPQLEAQPTTSAPEQLEAPSAHLAGAPQQQHSTVLPSGLAPSDVSLVPSFILAAAGAVPRVGAQLPAATGTLPQQPETADNEPAAPLAVPQLGPSSNIQQPQQPADGSSDLQAAWQAALDARPSPTAAQAAPSTQAPEQLPAAPATLAAPMRQQQKQQQQQHQVAQEAAAAAPAAAASAQPAAGGRRKRALIEWTEQPSKPGDRPLLPLEIANKSQSVAAAVNASAVAAAVPKAKQQKVMVGSLKKDAAAAAAVPAAVPPRKVGDKQQQGAAAAPPKFTITVSNNLVPRCPPPLLEEGELPVAQQAARGAGGDAGSDVGCEDSELPPGFGGTSKEPASEEGAAGWAPNAAFLSNGTAYDGGGGPITVRVRLPHGAGSDYSSLQTAGATGYPAEAGAPLGGGGTAAAPGSLAGRFDSLAAMPGMAAKRQQEVARRGAQGVAPLTGDMYGRAPDRQTQLFPPALLAAAAGFHGDDFDSAAALGYAAHQLQQGHLGMALPQQAKGLQLSTAGRQEQQQQQQQFAVYAAPAGGAGFASYSSGHGLDLADVGMTAAEEDDVAYGGGGRHVSRSSSGVGAAADSSAGGGAAKGRLVEIESWQQTGGAAGGSGKSVGVGAAATDPQHPHHLSWDPVLQWESQMVAALQARAAGISMSELYETRRLPKYWDSTPAAFHLFISRRKQLCTVVPNPKQGSGAARVLPTKGARSFVEYKRRLLQFLADQRPPRATAAQVLAAVPPPYNQAASIRWEEQVKTNFINFVNIYLRDEVAVLPGAAPDGGRMLELKPFPDKVPCTSGGGSEPPPFFRGVCHYFKAGCTKGNACGFSHACPRRFSDAYYTSSVGIGGGGRGGGHGGRGGGGG